jgi:hypothetical protein
MALEWWGAEGRPTLVSGNLDPNQGSAILDAVGETELKPPRPLNSEAAVFR